MATPAAGAGSQRRLLILAGVGVGLLALFLLVVRPLLFGGSTAVKTPTARPGAPRATTTTSAPGRATETFEVFTSKNPFTPPNGAPVAGGAPGAAGTTGTTPGATPGTGAPTAAAPAGGAAPGTTAPGAGAAAAAAGAGGSTAPRAAQQVALLDVFPAGGRTVANIRVNNTVYPRKGPGDTFGGSYKVVSLDGTCGTFLFGDERFRLCRGEQVLK